MGSTRGYCQCVWAGDDQGFTLMAALSPTGERDQYPQERRNVEPHHLFHPGLPMPSLGIHPSCRPRGQRGDSPEHQAQLQLESHLHDPNCATSRGRRPWESLLIVIFIPIEGPS